MARKLAVLALGLAALPGGDAMTGRRTAVTNHANPIRKVVNLLQAMQKKVQEEGETAEHLYEKFMCYCKTSGGDLASSITAAENKIPQLSAAIESSSSKKSQLDADVKAHQTDRSAAKGAMAEATALRKKEKAIYDKSLADNKMDLAALAKATVALAAGMEGSFLQTTAANTVKAFVLSKPEMLDADRQEVLSFLSGTQNSEYAPASGEIQGILKTMADEMDGTQKDLIGTETTAVKDYEALMAAKKKEEAALSRSIEAKLARIGELGVEIATMKGDAEDTADALGADKKFAAEMEKNCAEKSGLHAQEKEMRATEVVAIADTVKILNDDDALDLFKKTLPSASSSFLQIEQGQAVVKARASALIQQARAHLEAGQPRHRFDFVLLALMGRKAGFDKIVKLIDELVGTLKAEQGDDNDKKEYCEAQFDQSDDKKKGLENSISDLNKAIDVSTEGISKTTEEIASLKKGIVALDKALIEATENRKEESAEHKELMTSDAAAKELILFAKNRLNKFYNPKLYKAPPQRQLSEGDQIYVNEGGDIPTEAPGGIANTGVSAFTQLASRRSNEAPAPPPATAEAYTKKSGENGGVIAMLDLLVQDMDKEMTESSTEEKNAQGEYKQLVGDSAEKRRSDSKSLTDKEAAVADLEGVLEKSKADLKGTTRQLMGTARYISNLHGECDWLLQYFTVRQTARTDEIDSLGKAKAVLNGADYSLLQREAPTRARKFLRQA